MQARDYRQRSCIPPRGATPRKPLNRAKVEMPKKRQDHEPPSAISRRGWRYHHLGIPTLVSRPGEKYLEHLKIYVSGFDRSPYGIEWMRFQPDCEVRDLIRTVPHIAFEVDNLERALRGCEILGDITSPSDGVRVAMIIDDGAPVELLEFSKARRGKRRASST